MLCTMVQGQNGSVGIGTTAPSENAILHLASPDKNKGFMLPVYTTQERNNPAFTSRLNSSDNGLMIYDAELKQVLVWRDNKWVANGVSSGFYAVDPSDFTALYSNHSELDNNHLLIFTENSNFVTLRRTSRANGLIAPLHLPHEAVIEEVVVYYWDATGPDITIDVLRKSWSGENESILNAQWDSNGSSDEIRSAVISDFNEPQIDNENFSYRIKASIFFGGSAINTPEEAAHRLYGVKIKYSY